MTLEMTTNWLPLVNPGLYGTTLGSYYEQCDDVDLFREEVACQAKEIMNEIFNMESLKDFFGGIVVTETTLHSPKYYNYENDSLDFDIEIMDEDKFNKNIDTFMKEKANEKFFNWARANYGSHEGFISFFPYSKEKFERAIQSEPNKEGKYDFNRALAMMIMYELEYYTTCPLDSFQYDFEDAIIEEGNANGWFWNDEETEE